MKLRDRVFALGVFSAVAAFLLTVGLWARWGNAAAVERGGWLLALAASVWVVRRRARQIAAPAEQVAHALRSPEPGATETAIPAEADEEVSEIGHAVARLRRDLLTRIDELDDERRQLLSVVGGMKEGLLLADKDRKIRLANDAFRQIFRVPFDPTGHRVVEVVRSPLVIQELEAALLERREVRESVYRSAESERAFELHVTPLEPRTPGRPAGALILFFDITRLEALESVRREFVANVSHELRTPLTSIKAFVETLLEEQLVDRKSSLKFLGIVRKHAERMEALIDDLTDLSLIETGAVSLERQTVDVQELAREVAAQAAHRYPESGIEIRVDLPSPFPVHADRRRLEQMLVNLVDNAVKFNRPGGLVRVHGEIRAEGPVLFVEDTGIGIPMDSIDKVFHRFYRVDRARSREAGGTGLGLSIVKHLMRLHGGLVRLESEEGRGSRFCLEFPPEPGVTATSPAPPSPSVGATPDR